MDENHQDTAGSKLLATENTLWTPPLSTKDQKKLDHLRKKPFAQRMGFAGKTPWDFIQLLLIPLVLLVIGSLFSYQQYQTSLQAAADQQRETTLKNCLDDIKDLLLNKSLRTSKPADEVRVVARVEVLATLRQLDGGRKGLLMQFLSEAGLIASSSRNDVIIGLSDADLSNADLGGANLVDAKLRGADMGGADMGGADMGGADMGGADLSDADLSDADLSGADLSGADLSGANLINADLRGAALSDADLSNANLSGALLGDADLHGADLRGADLRGADLTDAKVEQAQLNDAKSLKGATMPDGSKHP